MYFGESLEEEVVVGHGVEDARGSKQDAVSGAEGGNEDGDGDDDFGSSAQDNSDGSGSNGVAGGSTGGTQGDQVGDYCEEVETCKSERSKQESAREGFLRVDDFSGAVRAELPAFVGP